jgi:glycosyltransferase involved in cell wall biosynthesis
VIAEFCRRHGKRSIYAGASDVDFIPRQQQIRFARDRWLFERGLSRVDRVVVQNASQLEACRRHYGRDATLIPSCYELPEAARSHAVPGPETVSRPGRGDAVLWVGTVHDYKRPELLLELARRLPHRRFVMIGGSAAPGERLHPGYYEAIRDQAAQLPNVEMTGFLPLEQVEPWFDRGRVLVNTSAYEGMPNTFLQAWARGIPTVAFVDTGSQGRDGMPVYDSVQDVSDACWKVDRLMRDDIQWEKCSQRVLAFFRDNHSIDATVQRYEDEIALLMAGP